MKKYRLLRLLFTMMFRLLTRIEVMGKEHLPSKGPFILAVNHLTILEPPVLLVTMPVGRIVPFVAREWVRHPLVGWILRLADGIAVDRQKLDRQALQAAIKVLRQGGVLGLAPEGTRSKTGGLIRPKTGVAYMAAKANVPIVPVGISGQLDLKQKWLRFKRPLLRVRIGPPIHLPPLRGRHKTEQLIAYTDQVMIAIARLIDPELRGVYATAAAQPGADI